MDYSSLPNDPGTSPWAASSAAASTPSLTSPQQSQQQYSGFAQDDEQQQQASQVSSNISDLQPQQNQQYQQQRGFSSSEAQYTDRFRDGGGNTGAGPRSGSQPYSSSHEYHQENSQTRPRNGQAQGDARLPGYGKQPQQQQQQQQRAIQYKLQAKVTGLERTGRKDPILRFDVYVSFLSS